ncbi:hypothetical protein H1D32_03015 [Anaerobacillus sp. CMMVII]|uniref:hypothetical protein n=1 Tax=Anaerobacillus sp. CMMVII TaxID=2755588 RepID=UPI0021B6FF1C|nr:hypothetical protein [Anaerobacillus sp. CMMVII]MCT8136817.1 hypothetical protein [Anaerobacillus sp. CMMVII]
MKMPNDDFLEPLRKRPSISPRKEFEESLHQKMFEEVKRRRSMASWKFRLGMVAVLLLLILINPVELLLSDKNTGVESSLPKTSEKADYAVIAEEKVETDVDFKSENTTLKEMHEALINFGVSEEGANVFIAYHYGLVRNDAGIIEQHGFFSDYEKMEIVEKLLTYVKENVDLSTMKVTNVERSLAEPDFFVTVQYVNFSGDQLEFEYVLAGNGEYVYDPMKNMNRYFVQKKLIDVNGASVVIPYFQGQLKGIGESSSIDELNMLIQNRAVLASYDNELGLHGNVTGSIIYEIDKLISIQFRTEWSSDELAHPYAMSSFLTFDLGKGRAMELLDFISEKELENLEEKIRTMLKYDKKFENVNTDELNIKKDQPYYLSTWDGNIVLYFPRYQLSSSIEVHIHPTLGVLD